MCDDSVVRWRSDFHHLLTGWRDGLTLRWPERGMKMQDGSTIRSHTGPSKEGMWGKTTDLPLVKQ